MPVKRKTQKAKPKPSNNKRNTTRRTRRPGRRNRNRMRNSTKSEFAPLVYAAPQFKNPLSSTNTFTGMEFLQTVQMSTSATAQTMLLELDIDPSQWSTTRLNLQSNIWGYYRFDKCRFHFQSTSATTYAGQIAVGTDTSIDFSPTIGGIPIQYILALPGSRTAPVWQSFTVDFDCNAKHRPYNWFQLSNSQGGTGTVTGSQGRLLVACTQPLSNVTGGTVVTWSVLVEYVVRFTRPQLTNVELGPVTLPIGTSLVVNSAGASNAATWNLNGYGNGTVVLLDPPPTYLCFPNSPIPRFGCVAGGTIYLSSTFPTVSPGGGYDIEGTGVGTSIPLPIVITTVGQIST